MRVKIKFVYLWHCVEDEVYEACLRREFTWHIKSKHFFLVHYSLSFLLCFRSSHAYELRIFPKKCCQKVLKTHTISRKHFQQVLNLFLTPKMSFQQVLNVHLTPRKYIQRFLNGYLTPGMEIQQVLTLILPYFSRIFLDLSQYYV